MSKPASVASLPVDKRKKFIKLAENRTAKAIGAIRTISKLGNKSHYEYSDDDVGTIVDALNEEVTTLEERLSNPKHVTKVDFQLSA